MSQFNYLIVTIICNGMDDCCFDILQFYNKKENKDYIERKKLLVKNVENFRN